MTEEEIDQKINETLERSPKELKGEDWILLRKFFGRLSKENQEHVKQSYGKLTREERESLLKKSPEKEVQNEIINQEDGLEDLKFKINLIEGRKVLQNNKKNMKTVRALAGFGVMTLVIGGPLWGGAFGLAYGLKKLWDNWEDEVKPSKIGTPVTLAQYSLAGLSLPFIMGAINGNVSMPYIGGAFVLAGLNAVIGTFYDDKKINAVISNEIAKKNKEKTKSRNHQLTDYEQAVETVKKSKEAQNEMPKPQEAMASPPPSGNESGHYQQRKDGGR